MSEKMKACFKPHVLMHSLFGLGLGLVLATVFTSLSNVWVGVAVMVVAVVLDMMRKS
ncbi:MAG TPA: hypothetical protein VLE72_03830 [Candidatus Saccharimonadales bacterium]|nr:hypothetical protein [Candidatus Saccharimonadales bacterium]